MEREKAVIEAILFMESEPVDIKLLTRISGLSKEQVLTVLAELGEDLTSPDRGLEISDLGGGYQLVPKKVLWPRLQERYGKRRDSRLSRAAMETISIIAYSQPITRSEIENLRGVSADAMIRQLLEKELIREVGKKDAPGRPIQYGTSREFLLRFGLSSIADLPKLDELEQERFNLNG